MRVDDTRTAPAREPTPSAVEAEHCERVVEHIRRAITEAGGWISFERYMDLALYAPGLGYYSAGARKFGREGDFTTAAEISPLFGRCIASQCARILASLGSGSILEIGAGSGRLAVDILRRLDEQGTPPRAYRILEISADLRDRQRRLISTELARLSDRVVWLDAPPTDAFDGVVLANEVLDALPVRRFEWSSGCIRELGVSTQGGAFRWEPRTADARLAHRCRELAGQVGRDWPDPYHSEICTRLADWTASATAGLRSGVVFWLDYGLPRRAYYLPERRDGTLLCHFRHRIGVDPFRYPGLQDISVWVDFTALAEAGAAQGFEITTFTSQAAFLAASGIDLEIESLVSRDSSERPRLTDQAKQLMLPAQMGESFKLMVWARRLTIDGDRFALRDLRHSL